MTGACEAFERSREPIASHSSMKIMDCVRSAVAKRFSIQPTARLSLREVVNFAALTQMKLRLSVCAIALANAVSRFRAGRKGGCSQA